MQFKTKSLITAIGMAISSQSLVVPIVSAQALELEEVLVTARKQQESLQDVPLAVNVLSEQTIDTAGIGNIEDVASFTPGFDFAQAFGRQDFRPAIRGQSTIQGGANASLYVDGFYIETGGPTFPFSAIQRVEVVKGPQSALYGRRTLAGAINYVLKRPTEEFSGDVSVEFGEDDLLRTDVTVSGPISDTMGYMVSVGLYEYDGQYTNQFQGNELAAANNDQIGGEETKSFTGLFTFTPSDELDASLRVIYEDSEDDPYAIALQPSSQNNCFVGITQPLPPAGTPAASAGSIGSAAYNNSGYFCGEVHTDDLDPALETGFFGDVGTTFEALRLGLTVNWMLGDDYTLTSNTGFNDTESQAVQDQTFGGGDTRLAVVGFGSPFSVFPIIPGLRPESRVGFITDSKTEYEDFSQEFRLSFNNDGALRQTLGIYYIESEETGESRASADITQTTAPNGTPLFSPFNPMFVPQALSFSTTGMGTPYEDDSKEELSSWSVFGSVEYDISSDFTVGLELRYNEDKIEITGGGANLDFSETFEAVLPRLTADWQINEDMMLYGVIAKGNKPGSINTDEGLLASDRPVDEEEATSYELGLKSAWMDNRIVANAAIYYIDWEDQQLTQTRAVTVNGQANSVSILQNVGETEIQGFELDVNAKVTDNWDLFLGYAYTDSEIQEFIQSVDAASSAPSSFREAAAIIGYEADGTVNISGTQLPQTSKDQLTLSNTFHGALQDGVDWFFRVDYLYNSKRYAQVFNLADTGSREVINLRAGLNTANWDFEVWVKNATDDDTSTALIRYVEPNDGTFNPFNRAFGVTLPEKRQTGITARYRF